MASSKVTMIMDQSQQCKNFIQAHAEVLSQLDPILQYTYNALNFMTLASRKEKDFAFKKACITHNVYFEKYGKFQIRLAYNDNIIKWINLDTNEVLLDHIVHKSSNFDKITANQHLSSSLSNFELIKDTRNEILFYDRISYTFIGLSIEELLNILNEHTCTLYGVTHFKMNGNKYVRMSIEIPQQCVPISFIEATFGNIIKAETFILPKHLWYEFADIILQLID